MNAIAEVVGLDERVRLTTEEVYEAYARTILRWVQSLGGLDIDIEDAVQEVFAAIHENLPDFHGQSKLSTWIYGITLHVVQHQRRRQRWRRFLRGDAMAVAGTLPAPEKAALELISEREASALLYRALDTLGTRQRELLILFELEEMSGEAIAELKGLKLSTLWSLLHRARRRFLAKLDELRREREA